MLANPAASPTQETTNGIGGSVRCSVQPAVYVFHHDDGRNQRIIDDIRIVPPTTGNATLPSLLGMDILRHFRLSVDYVGLRVVLE